MAENENKKPQVDPARASGVKPKAVTPAETPVERPKVEQLEGVTAKKLKTPIGVRLRQAFTNDTAQSVGDYLLFDVAIPAIKATIFDLIQNGASRTLFGTGVSQRTPIRTGQINYNQISRQQVQPVGQPVNVSPQASPRGTFNFDGIIFPNRSSAERALTAMLETIEQYQVFAVSDLYDLVGIQGTFADDKFGWFNLNGADILPMRNGFILDLPPVQPIR